MDEMQEVGNISIKCEVEWSEGEEDPVTNWSEDGRKEEAAAVVKTEVKTEDEEDLTTPNALMLAANQYHTMKVCINP